MSVSTLTHRAIKAAADFSEAAKPYVRDDKLKLHTNCYSYALGLHDHGKGFPGQLMHNPNSAPRSSNKSDMNISSIFEKLTQDDGLVLIAPDKISDIGDQRLIAAFVDEGVDCHFFTRHQDGTWSHQKGHGGKVTNEDDYGFIISDPRKAVIRDYDQFVGFFAAPETGLSYYTDPHKLEVF